MAITLYGTANSRANRVIWALKELGLDYEHKPIDFRKGETNTPEYLAMNPMPTLPTLKDGDTVIHESMAINLYLAKKYAGSGNLTKLTDQQEAEATQWSFWSMWNLERHTTEILMHSMMLPEAQRDKGAIERAKQALQRPLGAIEKYFGTHKFLLGDKFTIADLNMACTAAALIRFNVDISAFPKFKAWLETCRARPGQVAASEAQQAAAKAA